MLIVESNLFLNAFTMNEPDPSQVLVITGSTNDETINYGHKQVTLHKEELVFYHNGERHSFSMSDLSEISIVPANPNHSEYLQQNFIHAEIFLFFNSYIT